MKLFCHLFSCISRIILLSLAVICLSCVRDLEMNSGENPAIAIECVLQDETPQTLSLIYTRTGRHEASVPITDAGVTLLDKTSGTSCGAFTHSVDRTWTLDYAAVPGHEYRLEVKVPGHDLIYAEDIMPEPLDLKSINANAPYSSMRIIAEKYGDGFIGNVYWIKELPQYTWLCALNYNRETGKHEIAENICTDYPWIDNFNLTGNSYAAPPPSDEEYRFTWNGITYAGYYRRFEYPFLDGMAMHRRFLRLRAPSEEEWKEYISCHKEEYFDYGKHLFTVNGSFSGDFYDGSSKSDPGKLGYVLSMSVSENYDAYLRDAMRIQQMQESTDMSTLYVRDNLYSNIVGGIGIFGASIKRIQAWSRWSNQETVEKTVEQD